MTSDTSSDPETDNDGANPDARPVSPDAPPESQDAQHEWLEAPAPTQADNATLVVDVEGFEGPLDLLLAMARTQKVDVSQISVLALAEQYLAFIDKTLSLRLEIAADYLVMAAWLAFLKSRLLLPDDNADTDQMSAQEMAQRLSFRLMRLEAMRGAAAQLMNRRRLGRDIFARGCPEGFERVRDTKYTAELFDLLKSYATQRQRTIKAVHTIKKRTVWSVKKARTRLQILIGESQQSWVQLDLFIEKYLPTQADTKTVRASTFGASLEMAREGIVELRQSGPFAPIFMRTCAPDENNPGEWQQIAGRQNETADTGKTP